jgi:carnosine N-methyltransferase
MSFATSDILLAGFFPLLVLIVGFRYRLDLQALFSPSKSSKASADHFSLQKAFYSYSYYSQLSSNELLRMRASYVTLGRAHSRLGHRLGYTKKLDKLKEVIDTNARVTRAIAGLATTEFEALRVSRGSGTYNNGLGRVRETLKHFVRDWSEEGKEEREKIFQPILDVLKEVDEDQRASMKVLVPGCGLGRLAWEVSQFGILPSSMIYHTSNANTGSITRLRHYSQ